jgi:hypothetical protein
MLVKLVNKLLKFLSSKFVGLSFFFVLFDTSFGLKLHLGQYFHHSTFNTDH